MPYDWTQERMDYAKARWIEGASATIIAHELPGTLTRNAVIGALYRAGAPHRKSPNVKPAATVQKPKGKRTSRTSAIKPESVKHKPVKVTADPLAPLHTMLADLEPGMCKTVASTQEWGRPTYCGHPVTHEGASYCAGCAARFYVTIEKKPRRLVASGVNRRADYRDSARWGAR